MVSLDWILLGLRVVTTIILYLFLGIAFYIIWRDLKQVEVPQKELQASYCLRVLASAGDRSLLVGQMLPLQPVTVLGRDPGNTIILDDAAVSSRHACLTQQNGVWWLEDLGSRNGTLLNELPLSRPTSLTDGDIICVGSARFRLELLGTNTH